MQKILFNPILQKGENNTILKLQLLPENVNRTKTLFPCSLVLVCNCGNHQNQPTFFSFSELVNKI